MPTATYALVRKHQGTKRLEYIRKPEGNMGNRETGAPKKKIVLGNHINHLKWQTLSKSAHAQARESWNP